MADSLATLRRLRKLQTDQAKRALGEAVGLENRARAAAEAAQAARASEAALAGNDAGDPLATAFAAWLPASAQAIGAADRACRQQEAATVSARQALSARKAALEAVDLLAAERDLVRRRDLARRTQSKLDELGHRLG